MLELQDHVLRSTGDIMEREKKRDSGSTLLLRAFSAKMGKKHVTNHAKDCLCETKQGLRASVVVWHGPPPLALIGGRDPCQLQNRGCNTFPQETQDGS